MKFEAGDRVKYTGDDWAMIEGELGTFVGTAGDNLLAVEWDRASPGFHDCDGMTKEYRGYYVGEENLVLADPVVIATTEDGETIKLDDADYIAGLEELNAAKYINANGDSILYRAIEHYGAQRQEDKAIEEMAELTQAIQKTRYSTGRDHAAARRNLPEEIADVEIMIDQLKIIYGPKTVSKWREYKLRRLERRMDK